MAASKYIPPSYPHHTPYILPIPLHTIIYPPTHPYPIYIYIRSIPKAILRHREEQLAQEEASAGGALSLTLAVTLTLSLTLSLSLSLTLTLTLTLNLNPNPKP